MTKITKPCATALVLVFFITFGHHSSFAEDIAVQTEQADTSSQRSAQTALATFAGGCFWCMEPAFDDLNGVRSVVSGFTGGHITNPSYQQVTSGRSGHTEVVQVKYEPNVITYEELLAIYWRQFDPTDAGGSFVDRGTQYRSAIFYHHEKQKKLAIKSRDDLDKSGRFPEPIVTEIVQFGVFYVAEEYHQDYYEKNKIRYKYYRYKSGRDRYLDKIWGKSRMDSPKYAGFRKPSDQILKQKLTQIQYRVTQKDGTEPAFKNQFWDNKQSGIYVDIVSGEALFSSIDKYKSGTGWPSFTKPIVGIEIVKKTAKKFFFTRTELRSAMADSHLGHLFDDGPAPSGLRYCINSAALKFIPKEELAQKGYTQYVTLFE